MEPAPPYITVEDASQYLAGRPNIDHWANATSQQRLGALTEASDLIDEQRWLGLPLTKDQTRPWPRSGVDMYAMTVLKRAVILEAVELLRPVSERSKLQAEGVTSYRLGPLAETYGKTETSAGVFKSASAYKVMAQYMVRAGRVV